MSKQPTQQALLIAGLKLMGGCEHPSLRSTKYTVMTTGVSSNGKENIYLVGSAGALRRSLNGKLSQSIPCGEPFRELVLEQGRLALRPPPADLDPVALGLDDIGL